MLKFCICIGMSQESILLLVQKTQISMETHPPMYYIFDIKKYLFLQSTLEEAKALLTEIEAQEGFSIDMDTNGNRAEVDTEKETVSYTSSDTHMSTVEEQKEPKPNN